MTAVCYPSATKLTECAPATAGQLKRQLQSKTQLVASLTQSEAKNQQVNARRSRWSRWPRGRNELGPAAQRWQNAAKLELAMARVKDEVSCVVLLPTIEMDVPARRHVWTHLTHSSSPPPP